VGLSGTCLGSQWCGVGSCFGNLWFLGGSTSKRNSYHFLLMEDANHTGMNRTYCHWTQSADRMADQLGVPKR